MGNCTLLLENMTRRGSAVFPFSPRTDPWQACIYSDSPWILIYFPCSLFHRVGRIVPIHEEDLIQDIRSLSPQPKASLLPFLNTPPNEGQLLKTGTLFNWQCSPVTRRKILRFTTHCIVHHPLASSFVALQYHQPTQITTIMSTAIST